MKDQILRTRIFSNLGVSLCANAIDIAGMKLVPDDSKAYADFSIAHAFPVTTAYGTILHPGTVANSHRSMLHQVFNQPHLMRAYDTSKAKTEIPRDHILGSIVAVEFPPTPMGGWRLAREKAASPSIRAEAWLLVTGSFPLTCPGEESCADDRRRTQCDEGNPHAQRPQLVRPGRAQGRADCPCRREAGVEAALRDPRPRPGSGRSGRREQRSPR